MRNPTKPVSAKPKCLCSFGVFLCQGLAVLFLATSLRAIDVVQPTAPAEPAASVEDLAKPLGELVGKLAALETLAPRDLADFATETIAYSQAVQGAKQQVSEKPIHDALAGVAQGRKLDAKAADWDDLQSRLEKFLEKPEQQKQDQQQQDKNQKDDQKQDQQKDQQKNQQDQQNQSGDKQDQQQQNKSGENKDQQQQQQGQDQKNQQGGEQQSQQQDGQKDGKTDDMREQSAKPQKESAFGDMRKKEDEKKDDASQQNAGEQPPQEQQQPQPQPADMQQIGGADGKQQQPVDSSMIMPLRQLDQVRDKDAPAVLFQRMQAAQSGTMQIPADAQKPKGKDW